VSWQKELILTNLGVKKGRKLERKEIESSKKNGKLKNEKGQGWVAKAEKGGRNIKSLT